MGLNAYFAYTVVGFHGSGHVSFQTALTAIFIEGFIFFALALFGLRQWLARAIPRCIKLATSVGIGLFLTIIGLTYSEGIGLIVGSTATPVELAGCRQELQVDGVCPSYAKMRSPMMWIGIFCGGVFTTMLMLYRVKGAIIAGIILVSIISWPRNTPVTYFPYTAVGDDNFNFFKKVVDFHPIKHVLDVQEWDLSGVGGQFGLALITFLYVDILDTTGTLYSMARYAGLVDPVTQDFEGSTYAYMVDSLTISIGAIFGKEAEVKQRLVKRIRAEMILQELSDSESTTSEASVATVTTTASESTVTAEPKTEVHKSVDGPQKPAKRRRLRNIRTEVIDSDSSSSESESSDSESAESDSSDESEDEDVEMKMNGSATESSSSSSSSSSTMSHLFRNTTMYGTPT